MTEAVEEAVAQCGTSASASRLLSGSRPLHQSERELADTLGTEDAITLTSGHATNVTVIGRLVGPEDLIVHDSLAHDSILPRTRSATPSAHCGGSCRTPPRPLPPETAAGVRDVWRQPPSAASTTDLASSWTWRRWSGPRNDSP